MSQLHFPTPRTQIETLAYAIVAGQERYQRHTPLFDRLHRLLARGQPVTPGQLALHCIAHRMRCSRPWANTRSWSMTPTATSSARDSPCCQRHTSFG